MSKTHTSSTSPYNPLPTSDPLLSSSSSFHPHPHDSPPHYDSVETPFVSGDAPVKDADLRVRMGFVRKVYSILAAQLGLTTIVSALFMYSPAIKSFVQENTWMLILSTILSFATLIPLFIYRRHAPLNMYLLTAFTLSEAYLVGTICSTLDSLIVLQAVILTFIVFIGLTLFTLQSKRDFSGLEPFLFAALWVIILAGFLQMFLPFNRTFDLVMAVVIAIVFCGYIVYDTYMIFERLCPEEYIIASVELYLDVINLFVAILRILNDSSSD
ncbi:Transmembrane BAX inhibitor motif-containing protein 4 [Chytridiales sp. JEL 0842]|nr:Transmembrane BAX inhibitor motif-containing protein 4 [Chytridiales sp. JEL 0842]